MTAKLVWKHRDAFGGELFLGGWLLGSAFALRKKGERKFHYEVEDKQHGGGPYDTCDEACADLESEVRRLLNEAGVEVSS